MARTPRLDNQKQTSIRRNIPPTTEMYLWVTERNAAQKHAPNKSKHYRHRNEQRRKPNNGYWPNPKQNSK
jgi:hypothetical protein